MRIEEKVHASVAFRSRSVGNSAGHMDELQASLSAQAPEFPCPVAEAPREPVPVAVEEAVAVSTATLPTAIMPEDDLEFRVC